MHYHQHIRTWWFNTKRLFYDSMSCPWCWSSSARMFYLVYISVWTSSSSFSVNAIMDQLFNPVRYFRECPELSIFQSRRQFYDITKEFQRISDHSYLTASESMRCFVLLPTEFVKFYGTSLSFQNLLRVSICIYTL